MKISNFNTAFQGNSRYGETVKGSENAPDYKPAYRKASGGEDFLEISDEAVKRHKEARILSFEEGRRKKEARDAEILIANEVLTDMSRTGRIKNMVLNNKYDFNNAEVIAETAERVIAFLR